MKNSTVIHFGTFSQLEVELTLDCDWIQWDRDNFNCPDHSGYFDVNFYTIDCVTWYSPDNSYVVLTPGKGSWLDIIVRALIDKNCDLQKVAMSLDNWGEPSSYRDFE